MKPFMKKPTRGECWPILRYTRFARTSADALDSYGGQAGPRGQGTCHVVASTKTDRTMWALYYMLLLSLTTTCNATVTFNNNASNFLMDATSGEMYVNNPAKITGWGERSIVKTFGDNTSNTWIENYTNGSIVGQKNLSGVTKASFTNLVDANSNAICPVPALLRATSNLLLYTARTYSSSILVLRSRADSASIATRTTSNAVNLIYQNLAVPTTDSIDGTQFMRYHTAHHVFHNNGNAWTARGWVRFNNGFTVMPQATVLMDTLTTVSGAIDLRDTGILSLNNDLYLTHNVTLTNGGNIKGQASSSGQANTIFMGGDLTLASTTYARTLHITGDWSNSGTSGNLIIDGCGHTLNIGDRAQIFVDQNVTLTLRNMTIKTGPLSLNNSPIQLASLGSKLALDNVMFDLGADFHFITGQIFVHNEVAVTGTSAFVYQSPKPSYITSGATWSFEQGTTFSVAPSTFTDCPFTVNNTYTNNAFLVLADASAALSLNGCSFQTTFTGLRLRSGMVLFDNKVAIDTTAGVDLASLGTTGTDPIVYVGGTGTGTQPSSVAWSPDGRFLAVANLGADNTGVGGDTLQIYRFNNNKAPTTVGGTATTGINPSAVAWSPDSKFLAVTNAISNTLQVYQFNGSSTPTTVGTTVGTDNYPYAVAWSPDGKFLAVITIYSSTLQIFRFSGNSAPVLLSTTITGTGPASVAWSPNGNFLATVTNSGNTLQIYRFNGKSAPILSGAVGTGLNPLAVAWSPDGRFLTVTNSNSASTWVYRFYGNGAPIFVNTVGTGVRPASVAWSPDGRFFSVANQLSPATGIQVYRFNGSGVPTPVGSVGTGTGTISIAWSLDGNFLAVTNYVSNTLQVFRCNYYYTGQPSATQGFSNGLLFGDKAKGSDFDAKVKILSNATVTVKGMVKDDSF